MLRSADTIKELLSILLDETLAVLETDAGAICIYEPGDQDLVMRDARGWFQGFESSKRQKGEGIGWQVFRSRETYITEEYASDPLVMDGGSIPKGWSGVCMPIISDSEALGIFYIAMKAPRRLENSDMKLLSSLSLIAGTAIQRMNLYEKTINQLQRLQSARTIDMVILSSKELNYILELLLEHMVSQLKVDAAAVFLLHSSLN